MEDLNKQIGRNNYHILMDCLFREYERESGRKARLDSKIAGYFTALGIFFAAFLIIEPLLVETFKDNNACVCLWVLNILLIVSYIVVFYIAFFSLKENYSPKNRNEFDIINEWDSLLEESYNTTCERIKSSLSTLCDDFYKMNDATADKLKLINKLIGIQSILIIALFVIYISLNIFWR